MRRSDEGQVKRSGCAFFTGPALLGPESNNIKTRHFPAHERQLELALAGIQAKIAAPGSILVGGPSAETRSVGEQEIRRGRGTAPGHLEFDCYYGTLL